MVNTNKNRPLATLSRQVAFPVLFTLLLISNPNAGVIASESMDGSGDTSEKEHTWHANHAAVFVGGMSPIHESKETSLALGINYERRITQAFGVEALADFTIGSHERTALFAAGVTYRPFSDTGLKLMTGPGFELEDHDGHGENVNFIYGVGAAWEFHLGQVSLAPTVYADFLGETKTNITFGIGLGTGF